MLGWCPDCHRLVTIKPLRRFEGHQVDYGPVEHYLAEPLCPASGHAIVVGRSAELQCTYCDATFVDDDVKDNNAPPHTPILDGIQRVRTERCSGSRKPI